MNLVKGKGLLALSAVMASCVSALPASHKVDKSLTECTTQPAPCLNLGQNWTFTYANVSTRLGCNQRCSQHKLCSTWTWYEPWDVDRPNDCSLFQSCSLADHMCANCYTGKNCQDPQGSDDVKLILGGVDNHGTNLTSVEIIPGFGGGLILPEIPSGMAYEGRAAAAIWDTVYACGGEDTCGNPTNRCMYLRVNRMQVQDAWSEDIPPAKRARASATAVGAYGELYLIGGRGNGTCDEEVGRSVEVFNTEYKQWRDLEQPIPVPRSGHCAILKTDAIYLVGGEKLGDELTVDVYNITVGKWGPTLMVEGRQTIRDHACVLYQGKIIVTGGRTRNDTIVSQAFVIQDAEEALNLDDTVLEAIRLPDMISRRTSHKLTLISLPSQGEGVNKAPRKFPYALGGYNEKRKNVQKNELLLIDGGIGGVQEQDVNQSSRNGRWPVEAFWMKSQPLSSARSKFALASMSRQAVLMSYPRDLLHELSKR